MLHPDVIKYNAPCNCVLDNDAGTGTRDVKKSCPAKSGPSRFYCGQPLDEFVVRTDVPLEYQAVSYGFKSCVVVSNLVQVCSLYIAPDHSVA